MTAVIPTTQGATECSSHLLQNFLAAVGGCVLSILAVARRSRGDMAAEWREDCDRFQAQYIICTNGACRRHWLHNKEGWRSSVCNIQRCQGLYRLCVCTATSSLCAVSQRSVSFAQCCWIVVEGGKGQFI